MYFMNKRSTSNDIISWTRKCIWRCHVTRGWVIVKQKQVEQLQRRASGRVKRKQSRMKRKKVNELTNYLFCQGCDGLFLLVKLFNIAGSLSAFWFMRISCLLVPLLVTDCWLEKVFFWQETESCISPDLPEVDEEYQNQLIPKTRGLIRCS